METKFAEWILEANTKEITSLTRIHETEDVLARIKDSCIKRDGGMERA